MPNVEVNLRDSAEALVVGLARSGDRDAFAELVQRRQSWIRSLMRRACGDLALADDLAQQVFLQAWRSIGQLRDPGGFGGWLRRLAINTWLQHLRRYGVRPEVDLSFEPEAGPSIDTGTAIDLDRALASLAPLVRFCIVLSYQEGMTHEEIAQEVALPLGTVKSHIRRGTERLRQQLSDYREADGKREIP